MAWSGLLVLVVECVGKFSLPGGGLVISFFCTIVAGFGTTYIGSIKTVLIVVI